MYGRSSRLSGSGAGSRSIGLVLAMIATIATFYVAGRLWQESENRFHMTQYLNKRTSQGRSSISVDDTLKIMGCREKQKKLSMLEMDLAEARKMGFVTKNSNEKGTAHSKKRLLAAIGVVTTFGHRKNRDAVRKTWMHSGKAQKNVEDEQGIAIRFVIGRSPNHGDSLDQEIDRENQETNDFIVLDEHTEASEEHPGKIKLFFTLAIEYWDAEFYVKVNDDVYVNVDALGETLTAHLDEPRVYIGCMKSGEVFTEQSDKWYEPDWWKFGDGKTYFRHASGEVYAISRALAQFVSINRSFLRTYAHDDVSVGSWFIGLDVNHINEGKFCCSSWSTAPMPIANLS